MRAMRNHAIYVSALLFISIWSRPAKADLIIDIQDASLNSGGSGFVDVLIRSSDGLDQLDAFQISLGITQTGGSGVLKFSDPQSNSEQSVSELQVGEAHSYVFLASTAPAAFFANPLDSQQKLQQTDGATSNVNIGVDNLLLARLDLEHEIAGGVLEGGTYTISLLNDGNNLFLRDGSNVSVGLDETSFGNVGSIRVVPEPASVLGLWAVGAGLLLHRRRRATVAARQ